jgi:pyrroloquinoline quinone (PQQ) biosynthesis protein C
MRDGANSNPIPGYPTLEAIIDTVADWVNRCRTALHSSDDFVACGPDEVKRIASDLGIGNRELHTLAAHGPHSADLLQKMLPALGIDPEKLAEADPLVMRDLQRLCVTCNKKKRCQHELAEGKAAADFRQFCPNAVTLDALMKANDR